MRWVIVFGQDALAVHIKDEEGGDGVEGGVVVVFCGLWVFFWGWGGGGGAEGAVVTDGYSAGGLRKRREVL
jgi:hypothetical protein